MRAFLQRRRRDAAFTLTEIALCVAVIGVALVAIIGVLPSGLNVQKQNREDTLVAQDAQFLIESVRGGALSIQDLTNNVDYIRWRRVGGPNAGDVYFKGVNYTEKLPDPSYPITDAWQVMALLSVPRLEVVGTGQRAVVVSNNIVAQFRSFTSPFSEKGYRDANSLPDPARFTTAFRYQVEVESGAAITRPPAGILVSNNPVVLNVVSNQQARLDETLSDLRLTFQWPVFRAPSGDFRVGANRRTFRASIFGPRQLLTTNVLGTGRSLTRFNGSPLVTNISNFPRL